MPIPFSPGAENVTDAYREGWERTFGRKGSDTVNTVTSPTAAYDADLGIYLARLEPTDNEPCATCGEIAPHAWAHRLGPGRWTCEEDPS